MSQMIRIHSLEQADQRSMLLRLKRIEGQVRGIQQMVDEGRDCLEVLDQIAAVRSATKALGTEIVEAFALHCIRHPQTFASSEDAVKHAVRAIARSSR